jgi:hypothetical protein
MALIVVSAIVRFEKSTASSSCPEFSCFGIAGRRVLGQENMDGSILKPPADGRNDDQGARRRYEWSAELQ